MTKETKLFNKVEKTQHFATLGGKPLSKLAAMQESSGWPRETLTRSDGSKLRYELLSEFRCGDMLLRYQFNPDTRQLGLSLVPAQKASCCVSRRMSLRGDREVDALPDHMADRPAWKIFSLVQLKLMGDSYAAGGGEGQFLGNSETTRNLVYKDQRLIKDEHKSTVVTTLENTAGGILCRHYLSWREEAKNLECYVECKNQSAQSVTLESLASFSIGDLSPFCCGDPAGQMTLHRFRSNWSGEARMTAERLDELHLSNTWIPANANGIRYGHVGSWPCCDYFPFFGIEDRQAGVIWAGQLWHPGSWQMGVVRYDDSINVVGGLADRQTGQWLKQLVPGEVFCSPKATLTVIAGDIEEACYRLLDAQECACREKENLPDEGMAIVFNEWASSWGEPSHENMIQCAQRLEGTPVKYLVMDAGWYKPANDSWNSAHGDWQPSSSMFPAGLEETAKAIRQRGLIPGIWFDFETCGSQSAMYQREEHLLKRDGRALTVGQRRFLDFADPYVKDYLAERVIGLLCYTGMGYLKVDYNASLGLGVDHADGLGEGLRKHLERVGEFFDKMRHELPDLVIENCASGGMRLEPSMMARTDLGSFTDAHECREIPLIAAGLQRVILPRQSGVWVIVRQNDSRQQLIYTLASGFLGRFYLSGDICRMDGQQWQLILDALNLYERTSAIIKCGRSYFFGPRVQNYRDPRGYQVVVRYNEQRSAALVVMHSFGKTFNGNDPIQIPLLGKWQVQSALQDASIKVQLAGDAIKLTFEKQFSAAVLHLKRAD